MSQVADQGLVAPFERRLETGVNRLARLQKWNVNGLRTDAPLNLFINDACGHTDCRRARRYISDDNGIRTNLGVVANSDGSQDTCACSHVDAATKFRIAVGRCADRHLLKQQAIGPDDRIGRDYDPVRMGHY